MLEAEVLCRHPMRAVDVTDAKPSCDDQAVVAPDDDPADGQPTITGHSSGRAGMPAVQMPPLLVVLDLDETLVHAHFNPSLHHDFCLGEGNTLRVQTRPGVQEFLKWLRQPQVEVAVYTAGSDVYAAGVLAQLDPNRTLVSKCLSREMCVPAPIQFAYSKDLAKLNSDMRRTVLVDNSPLSFWCQPHNGILIRDWLGDFEHEDLELLRIQEIIERLLDVADVREVLKAEFDIEGLIENVVNQHLQMSCFLCCVNCGMASLCVGGAFGTGVYTGQWFCSNCWVAWGTPVFQN